METLEHNQKDEDYFQCPESEEMTSLAVCEGCGFGEGCNFMRTCNVYEKQLIIFKAFDGGN